MVLPAECVGARLLVWMLMTLSSRLMNTPLRLRYRFYWADTAFLIFFSQFSHSLTDCDFPLDSYTDLIRFSVMISPGDLLPSHTFCQPLVLSRMFRASVKLLSFVSQDALFLQISCTRGMPSNLKSQQMLISLARLLYSLLAYLYLPLFISSIPMQFWALNESGSLICRYLGRFLSISATILASFSCSLVLKYSSARWTWAMSAIFPSFTDRNCSSASLNYQFILQASPNSILCLSRTYCEGCDFLMISSFWLQICNESWKQPDICRMVAWLLILLVISCKQSQFRSRFYWKGLSLVPRYFYLMQATSAREPYWMVIYFRSSSNSMIWNTLQMLNTTSGPSQTSGMTLKPKSKDQMILPGRVIITRTRIDRGFFFWACLAFFSAVQALTNEVKKRKFSMFSLILDTSYSVGEITMKTQDRNCGSDLYSFRMPSQAYLKGNLRQASFLGSVVILGRVWVDSQKKLDLNNHQTAWMAASFPDRLSLYFVSKSDISAWLSMQNFLVNCTKSALALALELPLVREWKFSRYLLSRFMSSSMVRRMLTLGSRPWSDSSSCRRQSLSWMMSNFADLILGKLLMRSLARSWFWQNRQMTVMRGLVSSRLQSSSLREAAQMALNFLCDSCSLISFSRPSTELHPSTSMYFFRQFQYFWFSLLNILGSIQKYACRFLPFSVMLDRSYRMYRSSWSSSWCRGVGVVVAGGSLPICCLPQCYTILFHCQASNHLTKSGCDISDQPLTSIGWSGSPSSRRRCPAAPPAWTSPAAPGWCCPAACPCVSWLSRPRFPTSTAMYPDLLLLPDEYILQLATLMQQCLVLLLPLVQQLLHCHAPVAEGLQLLLDALPLRPLLEDGRLQQLHFLLGRQHGLLGGCDRGAGTWGG